MAGPGVQVEQMRFRRERRRRGPGDERGRCVRRRDGDRGRGDGEPVAGRASSSAAPPGRSPPPARRRARAARRRRAPPGSRRQHRAARSAARHRRRGPRRAPRRAPRARPNATARTRCRPPRAAAACHGRCRRNAGTPRRSRVRPRERRDGRRARGVPAHGQRDSVRDPRRGGTATSDRARSRRAATAARDAPRRGSPTRPGIRPPARKEPSLTPRPFPT